MKSLIMMLLCTSVLVAANIKVAVAANVAYVIEDLKTAFYVVHPEITVDIILGSTGKLTAQVMHGAPYEMFMAANMSYPQKLYHEGFAQRAPQVYAQGALAYISRKKRDMGAGMQVLLSENIEKIAIANPKTAPYGMAAKEALEKAGVYEDIKAKFVYGESISQTLTYALKAADIGIVAKSSLFAPKLFKFKNAAHFKELNASLYTPINQGVVILKEGIDDVNVKAFYTFLFSKKAQEVFRKFGYIVP